MRPLRSLLFGSLLVLLGCGDENPCAPAKPHGKSCVPPTFFDGGRGRGIGVIPDAGADAAEP
jgi:hypothetical protein